MPTVRTYRKQTRLAALPGATPRGRVTPDDVTGGLGDAIARGGVAVGAVLQRKREDADEARLMSIYSQLGTARSSIESEARRQKGENAIKVDLPTETAAQFEQEAAAIGKDLPEHLRDTFRKQVLRERDALHSSVLGYFNEQADAFGEESFKGALATSRSKAAQAALDLPRGALDAPAAADGTPEEARPRAALPKGYVDARAEGLGALEARARSQGWAPQFAEAKRREYLDGFHADVADALHESERSADALAYLDAHRDELLPGTYDRLKKTLGPGASVDRATTVLNELEQRFKDDPEGLADAVVHLSGEHAGKVRELYRERDSALDEARREKQGKLHGSVLNAIEAKRIRTTSQLEAFPAFGKLDDDNQAKARAYLRQMEQAERSTAASVRASAAQQRAAIAAQDAEILREYEALVANDLESAVNLDLKGTYAGVVSKDGLNRLATRQGHAKGQWNKDRGVSESEFRRMVKDEVAGVYADDPEGLDAFVNDMAAWRGAWAARPENAGKEIDREEVYKEIADRTLVLDIPYGTDRAAGALPGGVESVRSGKVTFKPAADQPYGRNQGRTTLPGQPAAAPGAPAAAPAPAASPAAQNRSARALGDVPGPIVERMRKEYAAARPGKPAPSDAQLVARYNIGLSRGEW